MAYNPSLNIARPKRKGLHALFGGIRAPFYFTLSAVVEGQPMKFGDHSGEVTHNEPAEMVPCVQGESDGPKAVGLAMQITYNEATLTGQLSQLKGYHFPGDTAQRTDGMPVGLLTGQGWALLENYTGTINSGDQLAVGPSGLLASGSGAQSGDLVPVWAESKSGDLWTTNRGTETGRNRPIRIRYDFRYTTSNAAE